MTATRPTADAARELEEQVARRRTFAIISHPDAGKTTLTEKLLLYRRRDPPRRRRSRRAAPPATPPPTGWSWSGSAASRSPRACCSSSTPATRSTCSTRPATQDFSEDTYRTLVAADSAVMLLDNRNGVEERTRQLFDVCKRRRMPIFTFVNKCDRAGADPLELLSDVEARSRHRHLPDDLADLSRRRASSASSTAAATP